MPSTVWLIDIFPYIPDNKRTKGDNDIFNEKISKGLAIFAKKSKAVEKLIDFAPYTPTMHYGAYESMGKDNVVYGVGCLSTEKISMGPNSIVDFFGSSLILR